MTRKLGCMLVVLMAWSSAHAASAGAIAGYVKDASGAPQMGAVVEVFVSAAKVGTTVFTDSRGFYQADNLPSGTYQIKVTAASFLPSLREDIVLRSGARLIINLTLNTLTDALKLMPARRTEAEGPDDWHWTLRSAANRPVLRVLEKDKDSVDPNSLVVVSHNRSERGDDQSLKASVALIAGAEAGGFGGTGDVTTAFSLEKSLFSSGTLFFNGNIGATAGDPTGVLRASYAHNLGDSSRPTFTVTYRHFAAPGTAVLNSPYSAIEMSSSDNMTVAGFIDLNYGADLQSMEFANRVTAIRPHGSVDVHLSPNMVVEYRYATSEPDARATKGFDTAPADLSESGPRMALTNGQPQVERAAHHEVSVSRRMGDTRVQLAAFLDRVHDLVLTGAGNPTSYSEDVLPDVYSGTFSYGYAPGVSSTGARVVVQHKISDDLTATLDYSTGQVVSASDTSAFWQTLAQTLGTTREHSVATKLYGYIPATHTRWITSYKWTSGNALSTVDAFNASPGQADPYLSIFIRQPLPCGSFIPAKMDALLDVRNLLAQGYVPVMGQDGRTVYMVQSARALRGGLAFTF
ncbi:MAG TPA: carboxypeptidase-like regulatory domain-containing protein [Candidatus Sulfotelmatobacter sp.]|nr:carboxypeptidase-like regulatory domain-containing protein [Candidatus Sulfotelmatobacter sp.]